MVDALSWLSSALAATATYNVTLKAPMPEPTSGLHQVTTDTWEMQAGGLGGHADLMAMREAAHAQPQARGLSGGANLATRYNKCMDIPGGQFSPGVIPQLWDCAQGSQNQAWRFDGNLLRTGNNMCLDLKDGNLWFGAPVQIYTCNPSNQNQWWQVSGNGIRKKNTNYCLDIKDGVYQNGQKAWQIWACDNNYSGNQVVKLGAAQVGQQSFQSASSFLGYAMVSWDRFKQLHPEVVKWDQAFQQAGAANNIPPTLLGALAATESSFNERPNNGWGLLQFSDDGAWRQFGGGGDRQKAPDAIWAGARYIRYLLDQNGQSMDRALRAYNGPLAAGGNPNYFAEVREWCSGGNPWN